MPIALKGKIYRIMIRPALIYGAEAQTLRNEELLEKKLTPDRNVGSLVLRWRTGKEWSSLCYGQGTWGQAQMVQTCAAAIRRLWNLEGRCLQTMESTQTMEKIDRSTSQGMIWRSCDSQRWMYSIVLNGEGEPMWLTPDQTDLQPEGDRQTALYHCALKAKKSRKMVFRAFVLSTNQ